ncbi:MAG: extracellular solute-binding protein [Maritimibacter sp.]|nr:extracellular solute-binding protein [Maritimibacter sp.]
MTHFKLNRRRFLATTAAAGAATLAAPAIAQDRNLVIICNRGNAGQREALEAIANEFGAATGTQVSVNNMDHEAHKTAIRNYLVASPPDINFWFSGERMRGFVEKGLFADITDLAEAEGWADVVPAMGATTVDGKVYGLPTAGIL